MADERLIADQAEALIEAGESKAAVKLLERERKEALADANVARLEQVLAGAHLAHGRTSSKHREEAGRVAYAAQQNLRFLSRQQALAAGQEWVDPFLASVPAKPDQLAAPATRGRVGGDGLATTDISTATQYAAWSERFKAWLLDIVIVVGVFLGVGAALAFISQAIAPAGPGVDVGSGVGALLAVPFVLLTPTYFAVCHGRTRGQTPGKQAVRIAVRHASTFDRITYPRAFGRAYLTAVFWLLWTIPGILDGLWPLWDSKRQALHDKAAHTVVIRV
jgi:uncharacterized RDD family membrane protein YckC